MNVFNIPDCSIFIFFFILGESINAGSDCSDPYLQPLKLSVLDESVYGVDLVGVESVPDDVAHAPDHVGPLSVLDLLDDLEAVVEAPLLNVHTTDVAILLAGFLQQIVDPDPPIHCKVHFSSE